MSKVSLVSLVLVALCSGCSGIRLPSWGVQGPGSSWVSGLQHLMLPFKPTTDRPVDKAALASSSSSSSSRRRQLPPLAAAKAGFLAEHGHNYGYRGWLDSHWQEEIGVRLPGNQHYLDFTGASLYANSQLMAATQMLTQNAFGNPHSRNPSSHRSAELEASAAAQVLAWLGADPQQYAVVWTRSATEALKMVGEWFPWSPAGDWQPPHSTPAGGVTNHTVGHVSKCGTKLHFRDPDTDRSSHFVYTRANHKSVLGIGAYASDKGALLSCVDEAQMEAWLAEPPHGGHIDPAQHNGSSTYSLVAFPAKDNYEGVLYPLDWVDKIHAKSTDKHKWLVMLDAAAYVPIHPLNLSQTPADFVSLSFYKVFGYPTGLGALVVRQESAAILHKVYFGGGAVDDATAQDVWRILSKPPDGFQDGTVNFLGIAELQFGFDLLLNKLGGMQAVHRHVSSLQAWAYAQISGLRHSNGQRLLQIFGRHDTPPRQSCLFQFLVHTQNGSVVPAEEVEVVAASAGIHLRTGCHCNPGQCLLDLGIEPQEERAAALAHNVSHGFITVLRHKGGDRLEPVELPIGSVRASLGALSTFEDVYALVEFLQGTYVDKAPPPVLHRMLQGAEGVGAGAVGLHSAYRNMTVQEYWNAKCGA